MLDSFATNSNILEVSDLAAEGEASRGALETNEAGTAEYTEVSNNEEEEDEEEADEPQNLLNSAINCSLLLVAL